MKKQDFNILMVLLLMITTIIVLVMVVRDKIVEYSEKSTLTLVQEVQAQELPHPCYLETVICDYEQHAQPNDRTNKINQRAVEADRQNVRSTREDDQLIIDHIERASANAGVASETAIRIARCESSLNPQAKNRNSSATGLYQFTDGTWEWIGSPGDRLNAEDSINAFMEWYPKYPSWWECK